MEKQPELKDVIVDLNSMDLPTSIVDMNNPEKARIRKVEVGPSTIFIDRDEYVEITSKIKLLRDTIEAANIKLSELVKLFHVEKLGDDLHVSYKTVFNRGDKYEEDEHTSMIMKSFIQRYSLDLSELNRQFKSITNTIEAKLLRGKPNYCEVDLLFNGEKEPVEC